MPRVLRLSFVSLCAVASLLCARPAAAQAALRLERVASGLGGAVAWVEDPLVPNTFLVALQSGLVRVVQDGEVRETPFLDLRNDISRGGERGLLGMAVPSGGTEPGRVFVNFTNRAGHTVVARFRRSVDDLLRADDDSRFDLEWPGGERFIEQPFSNHNGGHLAFGPDGFLYVGLGDGGSANDPRDLAQSPHTLLGKMIRIDVAVPDAHPRGYEIPEDNPFYGSGEVLWEIWALGLRNPWRYSFDDVGDGATAALIIGDVGQGAREEIDYQPSGSGGRNYGWRQREGTIATPGIPPAAESLGPFVEPIHDYGRGRGASVTGGYVYRGTRLPEFYRGRYVFGDFISGRIWSLGLQIDADTSEVTGVDEREHTEELGGPIRNLASFGRDAAGELYLLTIDGAVFRLDAGDEPAGGH